MDKKERKEKEALRDTRKKKRKSKKTWLKEK